MLNLRDWSFTLQEKYQSQLHNWLEWAIYDLLLYAETSSTEQIWCFLHFIKAHGVF